MRDVAESSTGEAETAPRVVLVDDIDRDHAAVAAGGSGDVERRPGQALPGGFWVFDASWIPRRNFVTLRVHAVPSAQRSSVRTELAGTLGDAIDGWFGGLEHREPTWLSEQHSESWRWIPSDPLGGGQTS